LRFDKSDLPAEQGGEHSKIDNHAAQADEGKHQEPSREETRRHLRNEETQILKNDSAIEFALTV